MWAIDSAADGNRDHADSEPLGFWARSAHGFDANWAFVADGEPLGERRTVVVVMDIRKARSLKSESEELIVTFFSYEAGGAMERGGDCLIIFIVSVLLWVLVLLNTCLCGVCSGLYVINDWLSTDWMISSIEVVLSKRALHMLHYEILEEFKEFSGYWVSTYVPLTELY
ncbi:hypothetical protein TIFTF001_032892 [Ficus carica]|uniref:Uncharacterized protein n=1 Tax=Ficus carica TaxID=3494 RepID=A0AA88DY00_FICCA|nr:hypothetical protein TIFTF001_032892 [Ficus carica]